MRIILKSWLKIDSQAHPHGDSSSVGVGWERFLQTILHNQVGKRMCLHNQVGKRMCGKAGPTSARLPTRFALRPLRGSPHSRTLPLTVAVLSRLSGCDNVLPTRVALSLEASHEHLLVPRSQLE